MDTQNLLAFISVVENASFSQAAEHLHLTQSAISKRIAALEQQLDTRLFDRIGRRIRPTESGQRLLPRARQIIALVRETQQIMHSDPHDQVTGRLTVGTSHHIGLHRLPPILRAFRQHYPGVQLDLRFLDSEDAYDGIKEGTLEMAIVTLSPQEDERFDSTPLWEDELRFVCSTDHPLCHQKRVSFEDLTKFEAVLPNPLTFTRSLIMDHFTRAGLSVRVTMATHYLETLKMLAATGLGWTLLPQTMIDASVHVLPIKAPPISRQLGYIRHRDRTLSTPATCLQALLHASATRPTTAP